jgi:clan AA aspartic protease (TIGR02281 family)
MASTNRWKVVAAPKCWSAVCLLIFLVASVRAAGAVTYTYLTPALQLYKAGKYKEAAPYFEAALHDAPNDPDVLYYDALCWHQLKDWTRATARYRELVTKCPGSDGAKQALAFLQTVDPGFARAHAASVATGSAGGSAGRESSGAGMDLQRLREMVDHVDLSRCPKQSKIYYKPGEYGGSTAFLVQGQIDGRPIQMIFDTGASTVALGKNHLQQLGLPPIRADKPPDGASAGVGSNATVPIWIVRHTVKVGEMEVPNCLMVVQEHLDGDPLLGQTFFKYFAYTVDYGAKSITLVRKDASDSSGKTLSAYDVPFERAGNELIVQAQINGKKIPMYFDTGAMSVCLSLGHAHQLGIEIPEDATPGYAQGISGVSRTWNFPVSYMKVGPIENRGQMISVVEGTAMDHPLLGQAFFGGWQYTIDNANNVIHFLRR